MYNLLTIIILYHIILVVAN